MKLQELRQALERRAIEQALSATGSDREKALSRLEEFDLNPAKLQKDQRALLAVVFYSSAKDLLDIGAFDKARDRLKRAHNLDEDNPLFVERLNLVGASLRDREVIAWRMSLIEMQRTIGAVCTKARCSCKSHIEIAACQSIIEDGYSHKRTVGGVEIYTLGPYRPYSGRGRWNKLLKGVKRYLRVELLKPLGDIMADFVLERTDLLKHIDVIVPVPPSPEKFGRRGFAPNDIVAQRLGRRLALPVRSLLVRKVGTATKYADYDELVAQFRIPPAERRKIQGLSILMVEDIWTRGRTIPICAQKLLHSGATEVYAIALGKTE